MYDIAYEPVAERPIRTQWDCPEDDCQAILTSPALLADHLQDHHNWSDAELSLWWGR